MMKSTRRRWLTSWYSLLVSFEQKLRKFCFLGGWGKRLEASSSSVFSSLDPLCSSGLFVSVFGIGAAMSPPPPKREKKRKVLFWILWSLGQKKAVILGGARGRGWEEESLWISCVLLFFLFCWSPFCVLMSGIVSILCSCFFWVLWILQLPA